MLGEHVALKVLRPDLATDGKWLRRLAREVKVARAIRHPNLCRVYELGCEGEDHFVTMELAAHGTLRERLDRRTSADGRPS
jgi:serine/threonine-protein kinase